MAGSLGGAKVGIVVGVGFDFGMLLLAVLEAEVREKNEAVPVYYDQAHLYQIEEADAEIYVLRGAVSLGKAPSLTPVGTEVLALEVPEGLENCFRLKRQ